MIEFSRSDIWGQVAGSQNRGVAQLVARLVRDQEVGGSNPPAPILRIEIAPIEQATRLLEKDLEFIHG